MLFDEESGRSSNSLAKQLEQIAMGGTYDSHSRGKEGKLHFWVKDPDGNNSLGVICRSCSLRVR